MLSAETEFPSGSHYKHLQMNRLLFFLPLHIDEQPNLLKILRTQNLMMNYWVKRNQPKRMKVPAMGRQKNLCSQNLKNGNNVNVW